jgi:hypothetical protein
MKTKKVISRHRNSKNTKKRIVNSSSNSNKKSIKSIKRTNITRKRGYIGKGGGVEGSRYVPPHKRKEDDIEVFTNTDHYIGYKKGEKYYYVSPYELNTAVLQYLVDNDKLVFYKKEKQAEKSNWRNPKPEYEDEIYMGFKDFPSLVVEESNTMKQTQASKGIFVEIYEDNTIPILDRDENNKNFENNKFNYNAKYITHTGKYILPKKKEIIQLEQDISYLNSIINNLKNNTYMCDLEKSQYNIIYGIKKEEIINFMIDGKNYNVIIVGYPNPSKMNMHLYFDDELSKIRKEHKNEYNSYLIGLYNSFVDEKNKINNESDLLKLSKINSGIKYINKVIDEKYKSNLDKKKLIEDKINEKIKKKSHNLFSRPNQRISYVFHSFIKINDIYQPLIYNIREINQNHTIILQKIQELIYTEIPKKFDILHDGENKYDNFHAYYKYGDIFHIKVEYLHPISNLDLYAHIYQNSISLEELIYSTTLKNDKTNEPFWKNVKFQYDIRNYRILPKSEISYKTLELKNINIEYNNYNNILENAKIIKCELTSDKILKIYSLINNNYYYLSMKPCLKNININILNNQTNNKIIYYECGEKKITGITILNQPIYKINDTMKQIVYNDEELWKKYLKNINFFKSAWTFPIIRYNTSDVNTKFIDDISKLDISSIYPYSPFNILKAYYDKKQSDEPFDIDPHKCRTDICDYQYFKSYEIDDLLIIIMKQTFDVSYKYIVWIFLNNKNQDQKQTNRIKNIYDIKKNIFSKIINKLVEDKIYNENESLLQINNFMDYTMSVIHFQIIPKKSKILSTKYGTILGSNKDSKFIREYRIKNLHNIIYKINDVSNYYYNYLKSPYFSIMTIPNIDLLGI